MSKHSNRGMSRTGNPTPQSHRPTTPVQPRHNSLDLRYEELRGEFVSPLPPPHILALYSAAFDNGAERIAREFEKQAEHRRGLEYFVVHENARRATLGLVAGFIIAVLFLVAGVYLIINGHDTAGEVLSGATLATLVGAFIYGSTNQRREREGKLKRLTGESDPPKK